MYWRKIISEASRVSNSCTKLETGFHEYFRAAGVFVYCQKAFGAEEKKKCQSLPLERIASFRFEFPKPDLRLV